MKLFTCFITHDRLELTEQAISSYLETVDLPFEYVVVDNASTDGTQKWLKKSPHPHILLKQNKYPGFATNLGWAMMPPDATHLHRADNDMRFLPGWCVQLERAFRGRRVGQVGLRTVTEENHCRINTGGNSAIKRELWDRGLRYDTRPWPEFEPGLSEDTYFSPAVRSLGYLWTRVRRPCLESLGLDMRDPAAWTDDYYRKAFGDRRIDKPRFR